MMTIIFLGTIIILNEIIIKYNIFLDKIEHSKHKIFVNKKKIPSSAGFFLIIFIFIFKSDIGYLNLFCFLAIFFIGFASDRIKNFSPTLRLFLQIFFSILLIQNTSVLIQDVRIDDLNIFLEKNIIMSQIFTIFCFLVLMNGTNFIDGINLNTTGYYIIVFSIILIISKTNNLNLDFDFNHKILIFLSLIYLLNFLNKTQLGDSGAYLLSFFTAYYVIKFVNLNPLVSPYFAVLVLWYPCFENLFSITRKIYQNKNISKADNLHLHHNIFSLLKGKFNTKANNISGFIVNLINLLLLILSINYFNSTKHLILIISFNIFLYILFYNILLKSILKKKSVK